MVVVLLYVSAPQGRIEGIATLKLQHLGELKVKGYALNRQFKTAKQFMFQPVILSDLARPMIQLYLEHVRPMVVPATRALHPGDALWLNFEGEPYVNIGRLPLEYFRDQMGLRITTTTLRSMLETETQQKKDAGLITDAERDAICTVVGHSNATAHDYYVRMDMDVTVQNARRAYGMTAVLGELEEAQPYVVEEWGTEHPDRYQTGRCRWTHDEIDYLDSLANAILAENRALYAGRLMSECLRRIRADPETRRIFHARHVFDSARLRGGYRQFMVPTNDI